jgi:hypothetical protein
VESAQSYKRPILELKTRPMFHPVSQSLSMPQSTPSVQNPIELNHPQMAVSIPGNKLVRLFTFIAFLQRAKRARFKLV